MSDVEIIRSDMLGAVPHGFLGRRGGVSTGHVEGLNVGYGSKDDRASIDENRRRAIAAVLPGAELATVHQKHTAIVIRADHAWPQRERPIADGMVTNRAGLLLGILTADCAPVLLADVEAGVIGAAHAGWRGALAGVTDAIVAQMEQLGAKRENIRSSVGPCIAQPNYEVDEAFRRHFLDQNPDNAYFFVQGKEGKPHFDLSGYVAHRLRSAGLAQVDTVDLDTYADPSRFYSYRRATHRGEVDYGRQVSLIGLPLSSA